MTKTKSKSDDKNKAKGKANSKAKRKADIRMAQGTAADEVVGKAGGEIRRDKTGKIKRAAYEAELARLQLELVKLQEYIKEAGLRVVVVFEGRDAAGKGGAIKRIHEASEPARVPYRRAASAERPGAHPMVLPTLRGRVAFRGRDGALRPLLVQPR